MCAGHAGHLRHSAQAKFAGANRRLAKTGDMRQGEGSRKKSLKQHILALDSKSHETKSRTAPARLLFPLCAVFWLIRDFKVPNIYYGLINY